MWRQLSLIVYIFHLTCGQYDIRMPPSITKNPSATHIFRSEDTVTLECKATGVPGVTYEWKKNGFDLNLNLENIRKQADGTITISPATAIDEGFYQCFAQNQYGTAVSTTAHLQRAILDSAAGTANVLTKTVQEGQPFHIQADTKRSFPKPTYGWEIAVDTIDKNPNSLRTSKRIQIAENGDLYFGYALPQDELNGKLYKCTTYNPYLDVKAGGSYIRLTVQRGNVTQFAPTLALAPESTVVVIAGGTVSLRCIFSGNPEPSVIWTGPGNRLPLGRYRMRNFDAEVVISNIAKQDEGDYVCTASNAIGSNQHTIQIRVEAVPTFQSVGDGPRDVNVTEHDSMTFNCIANATPAADIVWYRDGIPIDPADPGHKIVISKDKTRLTVESVCRDCDHPDLMVIQCNASNRHGYAFASGYLNVLKTTIVTLDSDTEVYVNESEDGTIQLKCSVTSDPSIRADVTWYRLKNNTLQRVYPVPPVVSLQNGTLTIILTPNRTREWSEHIGEYFCSADKGANQRSKSVNVVFATTPVIITTVITTPVTASVAASGPYTTLWTVVGVSGALIITKLLSAMALLRL